MTLWSDQIWGSLNSVWQFHVDLHINSEVSKLSGQSKGNLVLPAFSVKVGHQRLRHQKKHHICLQSLPPTGAYLECHHAPLPTASVSCSHLLSQGPWTSISVTSNAALWRRTLGFYDTCYSLFEKELLSVVADFRSRRKKTRPMRSNYRRPKLTRNGLGFQALSWIFWHPLELKLNERKPPSK